MSTENTPSTATPATPPASASGGPPPPPDYKTESRKALIGTIIALAFNPLSLVLGYYLNHVLQAPRVQVEYTEAVPWVFNHEISPEVMKELREKHTDVILRVKEALQEDNAKDEVIAWLDGEPWDDGYLGIVQKNVVALHQALAVQLSTLQSNLTAMKAWDGSSALALKPMFYISPALASVEIEMRRDRRAATEKVESAIKDLNEKKAAMQPLVTELNRIKDNPKTKRSGTVEFNVGLLNSGDSDGVVIRKAKLQFEESDLPLVADEYTVIKAHSFVEVVFKVDRNNSSNAAISKWESLVLNNAHEIFTVTLNVGDKTMKTTGRLPE